MIYLHTCPVEKDKKGGKTTKISTTFIILLPLNKVENCCWSQDIRVHENIRNHNKTFHLYFTPMAHIPTAVGIPRYVQ